MSTILGTVAVSHMKQKAGTVLCETNQIGTKDIQKWYLLKKYVDVYMSLACGDFLFLDFLQNRPSHKVKLASALNYDIIKF